MKLNNKKSKIIIAIGSALIILVLVLVIVKSMSKKDVETGTTPDDSIEDTTDVEKTVEVTINNMNPIVGDTLSAAILPADATVTYSWTVGDEEIGTGNEYIVCYRDLNKEIKVTATGVDAYEGAVNTTATSKVTSDKEYAEKNPYIRFEVENLDGKSDGGIVEDCSDGTQNLGGIQNGSYTFYRNVNFNGDTATSAIVRASSAGSGGTLEIRLGSITGKLVGSCKITNTGDWGNYQDFYTEIDNLTGVQDLFLVFVGDGYLYNLNWLQFFGESVQEVSEVTLDNMDPIVGEMIYPTISPSDALVTYSWKVDGMERSTDKDFHVSITDIGKEIQLEVTGIANTKGTASSAKTSKVQGIDYGLDFEQVAYDGFTAYIDKYYVFDEGTKAHRFVKDYWTEAEIFEIVIDAYNHTGEARYKDMIDELYEGFLIDWKHYERNEGWWTGNDYNDDIMWIVIACTRAYMATGETKYLDTAKINFDNTYIRSWSDDLGGGLWWRVDNETKNACVNGPGAIAACLLGASLNDESYFEKAKAIFEWERNNIFEPDTGKVYDAYNINGEKSTWSSTYNQGTFIGAATLLYEHFGDEQYLQDAIMAGNYAMNEMYNANVMNTEGNADILFGFKSILTRWLNLLTVNHNQPQFAEWLQYNTWYAWNNRNSQNLTSTLFNEKTSDTARLSEWNACAAVALYQNTINVVNLVNDAYKTIEAEDFDSCNTIITEKATEGGKNIGNIKNGSYTVYRNVDFGQVSPKSADFRVSSDANGGTIEIRLGGLNGSLIGSCKVENTGSWNNWKTVSADITETITGMNDIFLVYVSDHEYTFNLNWFRFNSGNEVNVTKVDLDNTTPIYGDIITPIVEPQNAEAEYLFMADGVQVAKGNTYKVNEEVIGKKLSVIALGQSGFTGMATSAETAKVVDIKEAEKKFPYDKIEAESANELQGPGIENNYIAGVQNDHYAVYKHVIFSKLGSTKVNVNYSTPEQDVSVEVRVGGVDGKLLGTCKLPSTGDWGTFATESFDIELVTGRQDIYLVFKGASYVCNLDYFNFEEEAPKKDPYEKIEGESADVLSGPGVEKNYIAGIKNGAYAIYKNVLFGINGGSNITFKYATPIKGASVEIRLGGVDGDLLGVCDLESTGDWNKWAEKSYDIKGITGKQDICLVFKADEYVCNLDYFSFIEDVATARDPYAKIEGESADLLSGPLRDTNCINGILGGAYAIYKNAKFSDKLPNKVTFYYSTPMDGASVEIRIGSLDGTVIGTCPLPKTGSWEKYTEATCEITEDVTGRQDIYLLFKADSYVCNLDYFQFIVE